MGRLDRRWWGPLSLLAVVACGDATAPVPPRPPPPPPVLRLDVSTQGVKLDPDGYIVSLNGGTDRLVGPNGELTYTGLLPGSHTLTVSGLSPNCAIAGGTTIVAVLGAAGTTTVSIDVECGQLLFTGLIPINVQGIEVVETVTDAVVANIPTNGRTDGIVVSSDSRWAYAVAAVSGGPDTLYKIDIETLEIVAAVPTAASTDAVAFSEARGEIYVTTFLDGLLVFDAVTLTLLDTIPVRFGARYIVVSPAANRAWVAGTGVEEVDLDTRRVVRVRQIDGPLEISPDGSRLYIASFNELYALDTADLSTFDVIDLLNPGSASVNDITLTEDGTVLYVGLINRRRIDVYDAQTLTKTGEHEIDSYPERIWPSADGRSLYNTDTINPLLKRVSLESGAVFTIPKAAGSRGFAGTRWTQP